MKFIIDFIRRIRIQTIRLLISHKSLFPLPETAIIFAPHPDDEVFGCCGLMQRMLAKGKRVELIVMTGGGKSHSGCCTLDEATLIARRRNLTVKAAVLYGLGKEHIHFLDFPDGEISVEHPELARLRALLDALLKECRDAVVYYPHRQGEGWSDHVHTAEIAAGVVQLSSHPNHAIRILCMVLVLQLLEDRLVQRAHFAYGQAGVLLQAGSYQCLYSPTSTLRHALERHLARGVREGQPME